MKKKLKQAEKERIKKGFICHLCGAVMGRASKYYHLRTFHKGSGGFITFMKLNTKFQQFN